MTLPEFIAALAALAAVYDRAPTWDILTALRGPDRQQDGVRFHSEFRDDVKWRTSAVIRAVVTPWAGDYLADVNTTGRFEIREGDLAIVGGHFLAHVHHAALVLGLIPDSNFQGAVIGKTAAEAIAGAHATTPADPA